MAESNAPSAAAEAEFVRLFVLVPAPRKPFVLRVDPAIAAANVKTILARRGGWPVVQQRLCTEEGSELSDCSSLVSLGLHLQACPTLVLHLAVPRPSVDSAPLSPLAVLDSLSLAVLAPMQQAAERRAAARIQAVVRARFARRVVARKARALHLRRLCANSELLAAEVMQSRWRAFTVRVNASHRRHRKLRLVDRM